MKRYAVLISCEEYKNYAEISFCHSDNELILQTLTNFCDYDLKNVLAGICYEGSEENDPNYWYEKITAIANEMDEDDTFLFYFAGHGTVIGNDAYLLLSDTIQGKEEETALSISAINLILKDSKRINYRIIDACHSGKDVRGILNSGFISKVMEQSWATLASCSAYQCSYPDTKLEQGIFTYYVSEAIKQWERNKDISIEGLKIRVTSDIESWCKDKGLTQQPTLNAALIGKSSLATRNNKINEHEIIIDNNIENDKEKPKLKNEIVDINNSLIPWSASDGIKLPKVCDVEDVVKYNVQLKERDILGILSLYNLGNFEHASDIIWDRSIIILRERVLSLGLEFVSDMVGVDNLAYIKELPAFEVINLAAELGFINSTGKMRLSHTNEMVQHYRSAQVADEMPKNEGDSIVRACIQYILGYDSSGLVMEYGDFRTNLKLEVFKSDNPMITMLINSPYFYKKTTIRTLINLIATTEGAELETVIANFNFILQGVWDCLSSDDRYFVGISYSKYKNHGDSLRIKAFKQALINVHGFDYVPENLRSLSFIESAKNLKSVHHAFNNFYNEPTAIINIEKLGTKIPRPAIREVVSAILMVSIGNYYGRAYGIMDTVNKVLNKLSPEDWKYYLDQCMCYDEDVLSKIMSGDERTLRWCSLAKDYQLNKIEYNDGKIADLIKYSVLEDKNNVKAKAMMFYNKLIK
jgi:hypothetical protein